MTIHGDSIPNCVPEYYRSMMEPDHDPEIDERNKAYYAANRKNLEEAEKQGLRVFCCGECESCYGCPYADTHTQTGPDDDMDAIICRREGGPCEKGQKIWEEKYPPRYYTDEDGNTRQLSDDEHFEFGVLWTLKDGGWYDANGRSYNEAYFEEQDKAIAGIEKRILDGEIILDLDAFEPMDPNGREMEGNVTVEGKDICVYLSDSNEKSYERQAAEQIHSHMDR